MCIRDRLKDVVYDNLVYVLGKDNCHRNGPGGSTDASDVSNIMPVVHMRIGGACGVGHGADYQIKRPDIAVIAAAKIMACTAIDLLANGAEKALNVKANFKAPMTKEEYQMCIRDSDQAGKAIGGDNSGNLLIHIPGTMPGEAICFNAHQDTVEPGRCV